MTRYINPEMYEPSYYPYGLSGLSMISHESPETAIARSSPLKALSLLNMISIRKHFEDINAIGMNVANTYLNRASESTLDKIDSIDVIPYIERSFFGFHKDTYASGLTIRFNKKPKVIDSEFKEIH